jgi:hypothetical protein
MQRERANHLLFFSVYILSYDVLRQIVFQAWYQDGTPIKKSDTLKFHLGPKQVLSVNRSFGRHVFYYLSVHWRANIYHHLKLAGFPNLSTIKKSIETSLTPLGNHLETVGSHETTSLQTQTLHWAENRNVRMFHFTCMFCRQSYDKDDSGNPKCNFALMPAKSGLRLRSSSVLMTVSPAFRRHGIIFGIGTTWLVI